MKNPKIKFFPISGSGVLHIDFMPGPFGDAVEAIEGDGVGFFSSSGELLGVTFDDVLENEDKQKLIFPSYKIDVVVKRGKPSFKLTPLKEPSLSTERKKKKTA